MKFPSTYKQLNMTVEPKNVNPLSSIFSYFPKLTTFNKYLPVECNITTLIQQIPSQCNPYRYIPRYKYEQLNFN